MPIKCNNCDYHNDDGQTTCSVCGADLSTQGVHVASKPQAQRPSPVIQPPKPKPAPAPPSPPPPAAQPPKSPPKPRGLGNRPHLIDAQSQRRYIITPSGNTTIGSQGCAILLSGSGIQPNHAQIASSGNGFTIEAKSSASLSVNGTPIMSRHALQPGDRIRIGSVELVYQGPATAPIASPISPPSPSPSPPSPNFPILPAPKPRQSSSLDPQVQRIVTWVIIFLVGACIFFWLIGQL